MKINYVSHAAMFATLIIFALSSVASQQKQQSPEDTYGSEEHFEFMSKQLNLTAEQKPKVKAIVEAQMQQWAVLEKNKTLTGKQKIERIREINQEAQTKIEKILTPEQRQKLQAIMEQAKPPVSKPAPKRKQRPRPSEE